MITPKLAAKIIKLLPALRREAVRLMRELEQSRQDYDLLDRVIKDIERLCPEPPEKP